MYLFLVIAGGVALILFGVRFLRKGLDRLFGPRLGRAMQRLTHSRFRAFLTGLGLSLAAPSSTTVSILAVQAVQAGHLDCRRMLGVMLGANIGLTVMVLLISLRLEAFAPILVLIGVVLFQFTSARHVRGIGQIVLALGIIFIAIGIIKGAGSQFDAGGDLVRLLDIAQNYPIWIAIAAALLTVALQSSTAAIALVIGLGAANVVDLPLAVMVVVGANIGLGLSTLLVGWADRESRRLAVGNLLAKLPLAIAALLMLPVIVDGLRELPLSIDKQIAVTHTAFNIAVAIIFLPLLGPLEHLLRKFMPEPGHASDRDRFGPRYITSEPIEGLTLATGQSMREILHVSEIVRSMLADLWVAVQRKDEMLAQRVQQRDNQVDLLDNEVKRFLCKLAARDGDQDDRGEIMRQLRYLTELETIGDVIDKNLAELAIKRVRQHMTFSAEGWKELNTFYRMVSENLLIAETAFTTRDRTLAEQLLRHKEYVSQQEHELRDRHFSRLKSGLVESHESSSVHLDLLTHLKRINDSVTHVAYAIIDTGFPSSE